MENTCNYSDEWQAYVGDYDKFEYDIKLIDGTIIENCYPNGGCFNSIVNDCKVQESLVFQIRFSQNPVWRIGNKFSNVVLNEIEYEPLVEKKLSLYNPYHAMSQYFQGYHKPIKGVHVEVRTEPKIARNSICPKCDSGLKFKICCGLLK